MSHIFLKNEFRDNFWGETDNEQPGIVCCLQKLKQSQSECEELLSFAQSRLHAEEEYVKHLNKVRDNNNNSTNGYITSMLSSTSFGNLLNSSSRNLDDYGHRQMTRVMERLKSSTNQIERSHASLSITIKSEVLQPLSEQVHKMKRLHKRLDSDFDKANKNLEKEHSATLKAAKDYWTKSRESVNAGIYGKVSSGSNQSQLKRDAEIARARNEYQNAVIRLDKAHDAWEERIVQVADAVQDAEIEWMFLAKSILERFLNAQQSMLGEYVNKALLDVFCLWETIDPVAECESFILNNGTGSDRPKRTTFQSPLEVASYDLMVRKLHHGSNRKNWARRISKSIQSASVSRRNSRSSSIFDINANNYDDAPPLPNNDIVKLPDGNPKQSNYIDYVPNEYKPQTAHYNQHDYSDVSTVSNGFTKDNLNYYIRNNDLARNESVYSNSGITQDNFVIDQTGLYTKPLTAQFDVNYGVDNVSLNRFSMLPTKSSGTVITHKKAGTSLPYYDTNNTNQAGYLTGILDPQYLNDEVLKINSLSTIIHPADESSRNSVVTIQAPLNDHYKVHIGDSTTELSPGRCQTTKYSLEGVSESDLYSNNVQISNIKATESGEKSVLLNDSNINKHSLEVKREATVSGVANHQKPDLSIQIKKSKSAYDTPVSASIPRSKDNKEKHSRSGSALPTPDSSIISKNEKNAFERTSSPLKEDSSFNIPVLDDKRIILDNTLNSLLNQEFSFNIDTLLRENIALTARLRNNIDTMGSYTSFRLQDNEEQLTLPPGTLTRDVGSLSNKELSLSMKAIGIDSVRKLVFGVPKLPPRPSSRPTIVMESYIEVTDEIAVSASPETPWSRFWCTIEESQIWLYDNPADNSKPLRKGSMPKGVLPLTLETNINAGITTDCRKWLTTDRKNLFMILTPDKKYVVFDTGSRDLLWYWLSALVHTPKFQID